MRHFENAIQASDLLQATDREPALIHYTRFDAPDADRQTRRAVCGDVISQGEDGRADEVTCPDCRAWITEYDNLEF